MAEPRTRSRDGPAVQFGELFHYGEPEPEPAAVRRPLGMALKHGEDVRKGLGRDADAVVGDLDHCRRAFAACFDRDVSAAIGVARRVVQEVGQYLSEPMFVTLYAQAGLGHVVVQRMALVLKQRVGHLDRAGHGIGDLEWSLLQTDITPSQSRDVQKIIDQTQQVLRLPLDNFQLMGRTPRSMRF